MKKRNVMTMALSLAMVGVIAVGGTLAYLTAHDGAVTNTFTFVTGDGDKDVINVDLKEERPDAVANEKITVGTAHTGWKYTDVVPGQELNKAPKVTVETKVDAYVFIRLTQGNVTINDLDTTNWKALDDVANVYYQKVDANGDVAGVSLFTKVTVPNVATTEDLDLVKIEVAAIQAANFTDAKAAYDAGVKEAGSADNFFQGV